MRHLMLCILVVILSISLLIYDGSTTVTAAPQKIVTVQFNRDIRPILSDKCFTCHGLSEHEDTSMKLHTFELATKKRKKGAPIVPGKPQESLLIKRINLVDSSKRMPPEESHKTLSQKEKDTLSLWIAQGALYEKHWSFVPLSKPHLPKVKSKQWASNDIDTFILATLEAQDLKPNKEAGKRSLIRRLSFDLTGLPPSPEEIKNFLDDKSPKAYEALVDRLLSSSRYGEHMAKYWLDVVRFADTNGLHHDFTRRVTPYRDWVIRSFNKNMKFNDFIVHNVAGDLYENATMDQKVASGFNRLHVTIDKGTAIPQESFTRNVVDRVNVVGVAFLGLTLNCAVCHDHKFDPVTQKDFYQMFAFFNSIDGASETPGPGRHAPYIWVGTEENVAQHTELMALSSKASKLQRSADKEYKKLNEALKKARAKAKKEKLNPKSEEIVKLEKKVGEVKEKRKNLVQAAKVASDKFRKVQSLLSSTLVMKDRKDPRPSHILKRGAYDQLGEVVGRDTLGFLPLLKTDKKIKDRMDLAKWLVWDKNPLPARVTVNRFWQQIFGRGLVKSTEDFGSQGDMPTHPELLDYLSSDFVASGWDVKALIKRMLMSSTYKQNSSSSSSNFKNDTENSYLSRGSRFRLDSEMIRDQILFVSGLLVEKMYGKSVKPPQPPGLWKSVALPSSNTRSFIVDKGDKIYRRSLYTYWKRAMPPPQMTIFDAPTRESCIARRERTNTPLQALLMMNEEQAFFACKQMALNVLATKNKSDKELITKLYEIITSKLPDNKELTVLKKGLRAFRSNYKKNNKELAAMVAGFKVQGKDQVEFAAWTMLINTLFSLDIMKTKD